MYAIIFYRWSLFGEGKIIFFLKVIRLLFDTHFTGYEASWCFFSKCEDLLTFVSFYLFLVTIETEIYIIIISLAFSWQRTIKLFAVQKIVILVWELRNITVE